MAGNYIKKTLNDDFELVGLLDEHDYFGKKIFESYSIKEFIWLSRISYINRLRFIIKSFFILNNYKSVDDFLNFSINEVNLENLSMIILKTPVWWLKLVLNFTFT